MSEPLAPLKSGSKALVIDRLFKVPVERVFDAWILPEELKKWFGPVEEELIDLEADVKVGGHLIFEFVSSEHPRNAIEGQYLDIVPNQRLVFSWSHVVERHDGTIERSPESRVTLTFAAQGSSTQMRLVHENVSPGGQETVDAGWTATLGRLGDYLDHRSGAHPA